LIVATISQLVTTIIATRREQVILRISDKRKKFTTNFVTKTYSLLLNMYYSLALNYGSKSEG